MHGWRDSPVTWLSHWSRSWKLSLRSVSQPTSPGGLFPQPMHQSSGGSVLRTLCGSSSGVAAVIKYVF